MINVWTNDIMWLFFFIDSVRQLVAINMYSQTIGRYKFRIDVYHIRF
jgi:hypothetical protein